MIGVDFAYKCNTHGSASGDAKQRVLELLAIRPEIPIILATGYSEVFSEEEAKATGIHRYLMKPMDLKTLSQTIEECLKPST